MDEKKAAEKLKALLRAVRAYSRRVLKLHTITASFTCAACNSRWPCAAVQLAEKVLERRPE